MSRNTKTIWATTVAVAIAIAGFFVGCVCTEGILGMGFRDALNAFLSRFESGLSHLKFQSLKHQQKNP
jgi:hypothetical protein